MGFGDEQRRGVGAAEVAEQGQRHGAKAVITARGAGMEQAASRGVVAADRQRRGRLDGEFEEQHVARAGDEREALPRGVEAKRLAAAERARRGGVAGRGGAGGEGAGFLAGGDRHVVQAQLRVAAGEDVERGTAGHEHRGRGDWRVGRERPEAQGQTNGAAVGEDQPARAAARPAVPAAKRPQRRARKGVGAEQRQRAFDTVGEPAGVGKPRKQRRDRCVGGGAALRIDRGQQAARRAIGSGPCGAEPGHRSAHRVAARGIGAREMIVARGVGGHRITPGKGRTANRRAPSRRPFSRTRSARW